MTTDYLTEVDEFSALVEAAIAKYGLEEAELRYSEHVECALGALDSLIARTKDIDRLRAARYQRRPNKPKNHTELVGQVRARLDELLTLLDP